MVRFIKSLCAYDMHNININIYLITYQPLMPDGATGALPNAPDMKMGASSCEIETPKLPNPPLYPKGL